MIRIVGIGVKHGSPLLGELADHLSLPSVVLKNHIDPEFAWNQGRGQYHSTLLLREVASLAGPGDRILGVTQVDLFVPVLTFVFGEAQLGGPGAVVSTYRLREESYGLPPDPVLLRKRLLKEALHEIGHTYGLRHCQEWECVMSSSHAIELVDVKGEEFCSKCRRSIPSLR